MPPPLTAAPWRGFTRQEEGRHPLRPPPEVEGNRVAQRWDRCSESSPTWNPQQYQAAWRQNSAKPPAPAHRGHGCQVVSCGDVLNPNRAGTR